MPGWNIPMSVAPCDQRFVRSVRKGLVLKLLLVLLPAWHDVWPPCTKDIVMNSLVNIIIVLLILGWLLGYFAFAAVVGSLIHILLVLAVITIVYQLFTGRKAAS